MRELLDSTYQGAKRLFILTYDNQVFVDSHQKYFLPRVKIENYNIEYDGRNFYDQSINDLITLHNMIKSEKCQQDKVMIIQLAVYWILFISKKITD